MLSLGGTPSILALSFFFSPILEGDYNNQNTSVNPEYVIYSAPFHFCVSLCAWEGQSRQAFSMKGRVFSFWGYLCFWLCGVCVRWEVPAPASLKEQGVLFVSAPCQQKWQPFRLFHRNTFMCVRKAAGELRWKATGPCVAQEGRLYVDFNANTTQGMWDRQTDEDRRKEGRAESSLFWLLPHTQVKMLRFYLIFDVIVQTIRLVRTERTSLLTIKGPLPSVHMHAY